jgi:hypothetical protein
MLTATFLLLHLLAPGTLPKVAPAARVLGTPDDTAFIPQTHRRLTFQFDQRYSLIDSRWAGIKGIKIGVEWRGRYRAGTGLYFLSPGVRAYSPTPQVPAGVPAELRFRYIAAYGEYVIRGNPRWEISAPVQFGMGRYYQEYVGENGRRLRTSRDRVFLLEPTLGGHYRVFRWVGVGTGVGWRQAFSVKPQYSKDLNGPIAYLRAKLFLGELVKVARGRQRLFTQKGLRRADWRSAPLDDTGAEDDGASNL